MNELLQAADAAFGNRSGGIWRQAASRTEEEVTLHEAYETEDHYPPPPLTIQFSLHHSHHVVVDSRCLPYRAERVSARNIRARSSRSLRDVECQDEMSTILPDDFGLPSRMGSRILKRISDYVQDKTLRIRISVTVVFIRIYSQASADPSAAAREDINVAEKADESDRRLCRRSFMDEMCSICMQGFEEEKEVKITSCQHVFHEECVSKCLEIKPNCPMCRSRLCKFCVH